MRLGDTEVTVANFPDLFRDYPDIGNVNPISRYSGQKSQTFAALAHNTPSIIIRDVD